eukprot:TRINITY_DN2557_c0_g2_i1.p1 TRINITY_DN2557_c0_g2~~TRINITY_DN2557_c0_g2_i1.p1  ORF type:complete len:737 (-),score=181.23 TRINITY_DN2557_c0_g2_i1:1648-3858(-)
MAKDKAASAKKVDSGQLDDGQYTVERLLDRRNNKRTTEYLVKWLGYKSAENSWVKAADIDANMVAEFEERQRAEIEHAAQAASQAALKAKAAALKTKAAKKPAPISILPSPQPKRGRRAVSPPAAAPSPPPARGKRKAAAAPESLTHDRVIIIPKRAKVSSGTQTEILVSIGTQTPRQDYSPEASPHLSAKKPAASRAKRVLEPAPTPPPEVRSAQQAAAKAARSAKKTAKQQPVAAASKAAKAAPKPAAASKTTRGRKGRKPVDGVNAEQPLVVDDAEEERQDEEAEEEESEEGEQDAEEAEPEDQYIVDYLIEERHEKGQRQFLVKWKGYAKKHSTWENASNIVDEGLITKFEKQQERQMSKAAQEALASEDAQRKALIAKSRAEKSAETRKKNLEAKREAAALQQAADDQAADGQLADVEQPTARKRGRPARLHAQPTTDAPADAPPAKQAKVRAPRPKKNEYTVESIEDARTSDKGREFLVKWAGYDERTWEPEKNILDETLIEVYDAKSAATSAVSAGTIPIPAPSVAPPNFNSLTFPTFSATTPLKLGKAAPIFDTTNTTSASQGSTLFGASTLSFGLNPLPVAAPKATEDGDDGDSNDEGATADAEPDVPILANDDDDETLTECQATLYGRGEVDKKWTRVGIGKCAVVKMKDGRKRIVIRPNRTGAPLLNAVLFPEMVVQQQSPNHILISVMDVALDKVVSKLLKVKSVDDTSALLESLNKHKQSEVV